MIHFVLALGPPGSCGSVGPALSRAVRDTSNIGGDVVEADSPSGVWSMRALAARDAVLDPRWHAEGEALVLCNGTVIGDSGAVATASVLSRFRQGGLDAAEAPLSGTYNLVCCSPEHGLAMTGDFAAFYPLYYGLGADRVVISNRSSTVAAALGTTGWNRQALGWIVSTGHVCGEEVPAPGVRSLRAGHVGRVPWGRAFLKVGTPSRPLMPPPGTGEGRPELSSAEWDVITDDLIEQVRGLAALETPLYLQLSGGKDSRLLLSLLLAAGMTDIESYTSGPSDGDEVRCASALAAVAGIAHRRGMPPEARLAVERERFGGAGGADDSSSLWRQVARGQGRFDGLVANWAGVTTPQGAASLVLKGWAGEVYRYKSRPAPLVRLGLLLPPRPGAPLDVDAVTACLVSQIDPLRVLAPDEHARQARWLGAWVRQTVETVRPDLLPDLFYIDHRLGQIAGPVTQGVPLRIVANPLVSAAAASGYAELCLHARCTDRLHFEVMRRAAPQLVTVPFVDQVWRPEIHEASEVALPTSPFGGDRPAPPVSRARWRRRRRLPLGDSAPMVRARAAKRDLQELARERARTDWLAGSRWSPAITRPHDPTWRLIEQEPAAVSELFREAAEVGLAEICQVDRLCALTARPGQFSQPEELQLTSAIGVAVLLLGRSERVVETPVADREGFSSAIGSGS